MKSANWISQIGRKPYRAAPTPTPMMDASARGESMIRFGPYLSYRPAVARKTPPRLPTSSPTMKTSGSRASSSSRARRMASIKVISGMTDLLGINGMQGILHRRVRRSRGVRYRLIDHRHRFPFQFFHLFPGQDLSGLQGTLGDQQGIVFLMLLDLLPGTVGAVVIVGGVRGQAVGTGLDQTRTLPGAGAAHRFLHSSMHLDHVRPIHRHSGQSQSTGLIR